MANKNAKTKKKAKNTNNKYIISIGLLVLIAAVAIGITTGGFGSKTAKVSAAQEIKIAKSDISNTTVKFYPTNVEGEKMEVLAVKASDGSIRTAFNTCQVCYSSGKGYYKQEDDELVCQNCGNRFKFDQVGQTKGGCNPVPINQGDKIDNGDSIKITSEFLKASKDLFANWKTQ